MGVHYRPQLGAARRPVSPRHARHRHTDKRRRDLWDIRAVAWTLASLLLVLAILVLSRMLLRIWNWPAR
jgi:hypothetical protein